MKFIIYRISYQVYILTPENEKAFLEKKEWVTTANNWKREEIEDLCVLVNVGNAGITVA